MRFSNVRRDSSPVMAQSPDPRPASHTSDTRENFGDAEPSAITGRAIDSAQSVSSRQTPAPAEAVATKSPTVGVVGTYITGPDQSRPMNDASDHPRDAGPSNIPNVATASNNPSGPSALPALEEPLLENGSTINESNTVILAPMLGSQPQADQDEVMDEEIALQLPDQENSFENELRRFEQPLEESDDSDDDDLDIKGI